MPVKKIKKQPSKKDSKRKEEVEKFTQLDKEILITQIRDLEDKLKRCQGKCNEMEANCLSFKMQFEQVTTEKQNIVAFLRQNLDQKVDEISELQERLDGLQKARDTDNQLHEQKFLHLKTEYQETKDQLTSEIIVLSGKLASLEEFKLQKEEILAKVEMLQGKLKQQEQEHKETVRNINKCNILEKDKLKREMNQNLEEIAANFRQISNKQMSETTRRAIQENAALGNQMEKIGDKMSKIILENQHLSEINQQQKLRISTLEGLEKELMKRNCFLTKIMKDNNNKLKEHATIINELQILTTKSLRMECEIAKLQTEIKTWKEEALLKQQSVQKLEEILQATMTKHDTMKSHVHHLKHVLRCAAHALKEGLSINSAMNSRSAEELICKDSILSQVLSMLNTANNFQETGFSHSVQYQELTTLVSRNKQRDVLYGMEIFEDSYYTGDIGLIPRQNFAPVLKHQRKTTSISTQTDTVFSVMQMNTSVAMNRLVKSAAYRILHDINCSAKQN